MIADIQKAIENKISELYPLPTYTIYPERSLQKFKEPAFIIKMFENSYGKRLANVYKGTISFDVQYWSNKSGTNLFSDCMSVQETLMRGFDLCSGFRILNKDAKITDNVLHITLDVKYSEIEVTTVTQIAGMTVNQTIKE